MAHNNNKNKNDESKVLFLLLLLLYTTRLRHMNSSPKRSRINNEYLFIFCQALQMTVRHP